MGHGCKLYMQAPAQLAEATSSLAQPAEATSSLVQPAEATSSLSGAMSGLQLDDADSLQLQQALELSMSGAGLEQAVDQALQVAGLLHVFACEYADGQAKSLTALCGPGQ